MRETLWSQYTTEEKAFLAAAQLRDCLNDAQAAVDECSDLLTKSIEIERDVEVSWLSKDGTFSTESEYKIASKRARAAIKIFEKKMAKFKYQVNTIKSQSGSDRVMY
jgi:hypothetical protein